MAFDIDQTMLVYLAMITAGIFIFPISSDPPYYLVIGIALVAVGGFLVYRKSRKTQ
jgi:LPXTG-motif cell wall-anchored protein